MEAALWPYGKCMKCTNKNYCGWSNAEIVNCMNNDYQNFSPMTNADRIRQKTDEELAEFLMDVYWATLPPKTGWLDWLKQEVSDD